MRTITTTVTVYTFDELSTEAQEKAVSEIRERLSGDWWDSGDNDDIASVMLHELAEKFSSPGWDTYGVTDFPGIDGAKIKEWDLGRSQLITASGTLTRENAPALPWVDGIGAVELGAHRNYTQIDAVNAEPECTCDDDWLKPHTTRVAPRSQSPRSPMTSAGRSNRPCAMRCTRHGQPGTRRWSTSQATRKPSELRRVTSFSKTARSSRSTA